MEKSEKFGFNLPSSDADDIADISQISNNFRIIEKEIYSKNEEKDNLDKKQDLLKSGENIKTVNGESVLGQGNIVIPQPTIDQTYNPQSENAQSGKAVAEAVANIEISDVHVGTEEPKDENANVWIDPSGEGTINEYNGVYVGSSEPNNNNVKVWLDPSGEATINNDQNQHAEYFTITDDGIISLKPEYRGTCPSNRSEYTYAISDNGIDAVGSKNVELPKCLYIPERIGNIAVYKLAKGIFMYNNAVVDLVCPNTITEIPERFCDGARASKNLYGTENIEFIGTLAFQNCTVEKLCFPKLKEFGTKSIFSNCGNLVYADIGNVTSIPQRCFRNDINLHRIKNSSPITSVGNGAFYLTGNLKNIDFVSTLTNIGDGAFLMSRYTYDWDSLTNCTFGTNATSKQINPTDYWSGCTFTPCKNNLPTLLCQWDSRWTQRRIGTTSWTYQEGCTMFSYLHIYCGLHNLKLSSVLEFENIMSKIDPNLINTFIPDVREAKNFLPNLGLEVEFHGSITSEVDVQGIYNALAEGKYIILAVPSGDSVTAGHAVIAYGVNESGELLIADSAEFIHSVNKEAGTYAISLKNKPNINGTNEYCIVSLPNTNTNLS